MIDFEKTVFEPILERSRDVTLSEAEGGSREIRFKCQKLKGESYECSVVEVVGKSGMETGMIVLYKW